MIHTSALLENMWSIFKSLVRTIYLDICGGVRKYLSIYVYLRQKKYTINQNLFLKCHEGFLIIN